MLLHRHPVNEAREAAGALAVNSFWLSGCGAWQADASRDMRLDERLRGPALQGDGTAWCAAWQAIDADAIAALLAAAERGEQVCLSLCGERSSVELAPGRSAWWRRFADTLSPARPNARTFLESL